MLSSAYTPGPPAARSWPHSTLAGTTDLGKPRLQKKNEKKNFGLEHQTHSPGFENQVTKKLIRT